MSLSIQERLIVAADFSPKDFNGIKGVEQKVLSLAKDLEGTGIYLKLNSVLRAVGYGLVPKIHDLGLKVFADLKLIDIPNTMKTDGEFLTEVKPEILTVMCCSGVDGMHAVSEILGNQTEILGVTVLTSLNEEECQSIFTCSTKAGVLKFARMAQLSKLGGLILSPKELEVVNNRFELTLNLNTPGIRPSWSFVKDDDQSRFLTPAQAMINGAKRIVLGRPILNAYTNNEGFPQNPKEAVLRTLEEIKIALSSLEGEKK